VYAAQDSLPDTPLYPVKIMSEEAQTALAFQPETKRDLLLGFADRRVNEIAALNLQGSALPESVTRRLQQQLDDALKLGAEMPASGLSQALERVGGTVQRQKQTLTRVQSQVAEPAKPSAGDARRTSRACRKGADRPADVSPAGARTCAAGARTPPSDNAARSTTPPHDDPTRARTSLHGDAAGAGTPRDDDTARK